MEGVEIVHGQDVATDQGTDDRCEYFPMQRLRTEFALHVFLETVEDLLYRKLSGEVIMLQVFETVIEDFLDRVNDLAIHVVASPLVIIL